MDKTITYAVVLAIFLQIILLIIIPQSALGDLKIILLFLPLLTIIAVIVFAMFLAGKKKKIQATQMKPGKNTKKAVRQAAAKDGENTNQSDAQPQEKKGFFQKFFGNSKVNKGGSLKKLEDEKKVVLEELKQTENQFLKHQIDQETFDSVSNEKNTALVKIEAEIDMEKNSELSGEELKKLQQISAKKRRVLEELLKQRQKKVLEVKAAERAYLKRKINENSLKKISSDIRRELVSINSKINLIQTEEEISKIKQNLKESLQEVAAQKKISRSRKLQKLEDDVFEQIDSTKQPSARRK
ncbi:MAG: hypothetical protein NTZ73_00500 [Candidatus Diapherotrites archaeon]|nr:hypothetical protein [Candidatus Diapherotrites archaeon]